MKLASPSRRQWLAHHAGRGAAAWLAAPLPLLSGCTAVQTAQLEAARQQGIGPAAALPATAWLRQVPFVPPQEDALCGPASLAMLLGAVGRPADLADLRQAVYLPGRQGSLSWEMLAALRRHDLLPSPLAPQVETVLTELAAGHAVLVLLNLSLPLWPRWHYAVLTGYDLTDASVRLHTGHEAHARWPLATLEHTWARSGHWAVVALPPGELPATATPASLGSALLALEQTRGPAVALPGWVAMAQRFPQAWLAHMASGNGWLQSQNAQQAVAAYEAALRLRPSAAAWNNLAVALARLNRLDEARHALNQAQTLAERSEPAWQEAVRQTRQELGW